MVDLARPLARQLILAEHVRNTTGLLLGDVGYGQLVRLVDISDSANYATILGQKDTTNGLAVKIQYGDHAGSPTTLATFAKSAISLNLPATIKQADLTNPASGYTAIGARASDGRPAYYINGGSQLVFANTSEVPSGILTTTGDIIYSSSGSTAARRGIGTTGQTLTVVGGVPAWASGPLALAAAAGDTFYATGANALAKLSVGTAFQELTTNSGATAPQWSSGVLARVTTAGDIVQATGANAIARLGIGTARQTLLVNSGATALAYGESLQSLLTAQGDLPYASSANTPARLAKGSDGQFLQLAGGLPAWSAGPAAGITLIDSKSGTGSSSSLTFTGISGSYRMLVVVLYGRSTAAAGNDSARLQFNSDTTAANYDYENITASNTTVSASENIGASAQVLFGQMPANTSTASLQGSSIAWIPEYAGTAGYKSIMGFSSGLTNLASGGVTPSLVGGCWENTAAITSITVVLGSGNWTTDTRCSLYGWTAV